MTHICVCELTIIGSENGLLPGRRQAIIGSITGILLIGPLGTNLNFNLNSYIFIHKYAFDKVVCQIMAILSWPQSVKGEIVSQNVG